MNRFPPSLIAEIRDRIQISTLVQQRVRLKRSGRAWTGLCPWHKERTPSFTCDDARGTAHCFGCGEHVDVFGWIMRDRGLSFPDAVKELAGMAGVTLPASPEWTKRETQRASLLEVVSLAASYFQCGLGASQPAQEFLAVRGLNAAAVDRFRIGYAGNGLGAWLAKQGIPQERMIEAGLVVADEHGVYDRFRDRVMFPITDEKDRVIAFGGRALGDAKAKYLNSPETPLFHKGSVLYNGFPARASAWSGETDPVVVEGYMDTITAVTAGIESAVASMGTALTEDQCRLLWRMSEEPVLCFDGDIAGRKALYRAVETALPLLSGGRTLRCVTMPLGMDPDDMIRKRGVDAFRRALAASEGLSGVLWRIATEGRPTGSPEALSAIEGFLESKIGKIPDATTQRHFRDDIRDRLRSLRTRPKLYRSNGVTNHSISPSAIRLTMNYGRSPMTLRDATLIVACVSSPDDAVRMSEELTATASPLVLDIINTVATAEPGETEKALESAGLHGLVEEAQSLCLSTGLCVNTKNASEVLRAGSERRK